MNADEVCAMIDAITSGGSWTKLVPGLKDDELLNVSALSGGVLFDQGAGHRVLVSDPRTMREIAGLLIARANYEDGKLT